AIPTARDRTTRRQVCVIRPDSHTHAAIPTRFRTPNFPRSVGRLVTGLVLLVTLCAPLVFVMAFMDLPATMRAAMAPGVALMVIPSLAVLAPWIVPPLIRPTAAVIRLLDRRVGRVAAAGLRATPARATAMAVPVLLFVGIAVSLLGAGATMGKAVQRQAEQGLRADAVVTAEPGTRLPASAPAFPRRHPPGPPGARRRWWRRRSPPRPRGTTTGRWPPAPGAPTDVPCPRCWTSMCGKAGCPPCARGPSRRVPCRPTDTTGAWA
ncbi:hypothetical protein PV435_45050, partial [Streptomyces scabiei]|nr:hypothetical protein [Streptomyces scabiei]